MSLLCNPPHSVIQLSCWLLLLLQRTMHGPHEIVPIDGTKHSSPQRMETFRMQKLTPPPLPPVHRQAVLYHFVRKIILARIKEPLTKSLLAA